MKKTKSKKLYVNINHLKNGKYELQIINKEQVVTQILFTKK